MTLLRGPDGSGMLLTNMPQKSQSVTSVTFSRSGKSLRGSLSVNEGKEASLFFY